MKERKIFSTLVAIMTTIAAFCLLFVSCANGSDDSSAPNGSTFDALSLSFSGQVHKSLESSSMMNWLERMERTNDKYQEYNPGLELTVNSNLDVIGSISANGHLSFTAGAPDNKYLMPIEYGLQVFNDILTNYWDSIYTDFSAMPQDAKYFFLDLYCNGKNLNRQLCTGTVNEQGFGSGIDDDIVYIYVDKDVSITMQDNNTSRLDYVHYEKNVSLNLEQGWNSIQRTEEWYYTEDGDFSIVDISVGNPKNFLWVLALE